MAPPSAASSAAVRRPTLPAHAQEVLAAAATVFEIEREALADVQAQLDERFETAIALLEACRSRVIVTGMGKSGLIGRKISATFSSTGTPSVFMHPAEASHGDAGLLTRGDVVLAISNSGETPELLALMPLFKQLGVPIIAVTGRASSALSQMATVTLSVAVRREACPLGLAPTASTTATLALGDALAMVLLQRKGFAAEDFAMVHPAGSLGKRLLLRVCDLMRKPPDIPFVSLDTPFLEALVVMSQYRLGCALVVDAQQQLLGILTDGDVRRALTRFSTPHCIALGEVMTPQPKTIASSAMAVLALQTMETHRITILVVCDEGRSPCGILSMHDLLQAGLVV